MLRVLTVVIAAALAELTPDERTELLLLLLLEGEAPNEVDLQQMLDDEMNE